MTTFSYFRSESRPGLHAFTDDASGVGLPPGEGPWRFVRVVDPQEGWTAAAEIEAVRAGVRINGYFLADAPGDLVFDEAPVKPGD